MKAYWWTGKYNFGDSISPVLLDRFSHLNGQWSIPERAEVVITGSILEHIPSIWHGYMVGIGKMYESTKFDFPYAEIMALRGNLTAKGAKGDFVVGDPVLLVGELVNPEPKYNLGIVAHWKDKELAERPLFKQFDPLVINPLNDPMTVVTQIASCKKIVSSSLHGLVVADAFGIPRRAEQWNGMEKEGGDFKYRDYASAIGQPIEFGVLQEAPRIKIEKIQFELFDVFKRLGDILKA